MNRRHHYRRRGAEQTELDMTTFLNLMVVLRWRTVHFPWVLAMRLLLSIVLNAPINFLVVIVALRFKPLRMILRLFVGCVALSVLHNLTLHQPVKSF